MKKLLYSLVVLAWLLAGSLEVKAGLWYGPYWGLDSYTQWLPTGVWTPVMTGYWYGGYTYNQLFPWGGNYPWQPYQGWYNPIVYPNPYNFGWYPGSLGYFYGLVDGYRYQYIGLTPVNVYYRSYYRDPPANQGQVIDFITGGDGTANSAPTTLDASVWDNLTLDTHYATAALGSGHTPAGEIQSGAMTAVQRIFGGVNGQANLENVLATTYGFSPSEISAFESSPQGAAIVTALLAGGSGSWIGDQTFLFSIPEPSAGALLLLAGIAFGIRKRIAR